jgi:dienelactone hydrolase
MLGGQVIQRSVILLNALLAIVGAAAELPNLLQPPAKTPTNATALKPLLPEGATLATWETRRAELQQAWTKLLGALPATKVPLAVTWHEKEELPTFTRQRLTYQIEEGMRTDAMLLTPRGRTGWRPGLVLFHPTYSNHYARAVGLEGHEEPERQQAVRWAERGYVVLAPRCFLWADLPPESKAKGSGVYVENVKRMQARHPDWKGMTRMLWDGIRALDVMETLPNVDRTRIGIFGHSLGAKEVVYVAAWDQRVKCTVSSEGGIGLKLSNWHDIWYLGKDIQQPGFPREHHELLAMMAPRPFLLLAGNASDNDESWTFIRAALPVYELFGARTQLGWFNHGLGHRYGAQARDVAEAFMDQHLNP